MIRQHWRGNYPVRRATGLHLVVGGLVLISMLHWLVPAIATNRYLPLGLFAAIVTGTCGVIIVWQLVGALRSWRRHNTSVTDSWGLYALIFCYLWTVGFGLLDMSMFALKPDIKLTPNWFRPSTDVRYDPTASPDIVTISGKIEFGLSQELRQLLTAYPQIRTIKLNSRGGVLTEARGVALLIRGSRLNTLASGQCYSACTLMFIAGERRYLTPDARLGFHQYAMDALFIPPGTNIEQEQQKDRHYFRTRGVNASFLDRAYSEPHATIWIPELDELLTSGVIHDVRARSAL